MMRRLFSGFTGLLVCLLCTVGFAANPDNGPGCGLGKLAWADYKSPKNIAPQVMMATTNGTFGSQTFGISFGTSGCTNDGKVMATNQTNLFVASTFEAISDDMARGGGEHLAALATLMGVPAGHHPAFFAMAQRQYRDLVDTGEFASVAVIKILRDAMTQQPIFAQIAEMR